MAKVVRTVNGVEPSNGEVSNVIPISQTDYSKLTTDQKKGKSFIVQDANRLPAVTIKDSVIASDTSWSSNKINTELNNNLSALNTSSTRAVNSTAVNTALNNALTNYSVFSRNNLNSISIPNASITKVFETTLKKGLNIVKFTGDFSVGTNGIRVLIISDNPSITLSSIGRDEGFTMNAINVTSTPETYFEKMRFLNIPEDRTMFFYAYQNNGNALTFYPLIEVVHLGN